MNMSVNGTLPMLKMNPPTLMDGFTASVNGLMNSLPLLAASGDSHLRALSLVSGFILECALKAYLPHGGLNKKEEKELADRKKIWAQP